MRRPLHLVVFSVLLSGCFGPGEGVEVPLDQIYFPVGLALDQDARHLIVVSSDFDLQYNGGAVQSYDLSHFDDSSGVLPVRCTDTCSDGRTCQAGLCVARVGESPCPQGERPESDRLLYPARCNPIDPRPLQVGKVKIGAFATDAILRSSVTGQQRLFVPVRGDSTLHWLDVLDDGSLECGQASDQACDARHRVGDDPSESGRDLRLASEPFAIDATTHAESIVVTNQTSGRVALFTTDAERGAPPGPWNSAPRLQFTLEGLPQRPVGVAALAPTALEQQAIDAGRAPAYTFLLTFRDSAQVRLFRTAPDAGSTALRPYLVDGGGVAISANSVGSDSRGVAVDDSARKAAEALCSADDASCLGQAALVPLDVYVANRSPASLLIGRTRPPQQHPSFFQALPLTTGPSRVLVGKVQTASGEQETRVFVVCFESRRVFVYDPQRSRIETEIFTGRGPHAVAVDAPRRLLYIGHFTDSYIGVYSLDMAFPDTYGTMLGMLGAPKSPRSSK